MPLQALILEIYIVKRPLVANFYVILVPPEPRNPYIYNLNPNSYPL